MSASDVFISYASEDVEQARRLAGQFDALGWSVWWDRTMRPGGAFTKEITAALKSAKAIVVLWSVSSVDSTWVQNEARRGSKRGVLVPALIDGVEELPLEFEHLDAARLTQWDGSAEFAEFVRLVNAIAQLVGATAARAAGRTSDTTRTPKRVAPAAQPLEPQEAVQSIAAEPPTSTRTRRRFTRARLAPSPPIDDANLDLSTLDGPAWVSLPTGSFMMGSSDGGDDEKPVHRVTMSAFRISRFPVTNRQYARYVKDANARAPSHWTEGNIPEGSEDHPVVNVSWGNASAFAAWLSSRVSPRFGGKVTLPTEAHWEYAAAGPDDRKYPWGDEAPTPARANFRGKNAGGTSPVGAYALGATPDGVHDLVGNVWEWCRDWYGAYTRAEQHDPVGPPQGMSRVFRGGSFRDRARSLRGSLRVGLHPGHEDGGLGFRVAWVPADGS